MTATNINALAETHGKTPRMIRNYLAAVSEATGRDPITSPGIVADWAVSEVDKLIELGGPAAYKRAASQSPAPQATQSGYELATVPQASQSTFTPVIDVATAPAATVPTFTVIDGGLSAPIPAIPTAAPIVPMGQVGSQILQTTASAQMATQAVGQMVGALKQRLAIGLDTLYAQDVQSVQAIESLETELIELQTMAAEYDRAARVTAVKETMRADRVGKLTAQMGQTAARLGFQLQPQSQSAV